MKEWKLWLSHWKKINPFISRYRIISQLLGGKKVFITTVTALLIWSAACLQFADTLIQWQCQLKQLPPSSHHQQFDPVLFMRADVWEVQGEQVSNSLYPSSPPKYCFYQLGEFLNCTNSRLGDLEIRTSCMKNRAGALKVLKTTWTILP